MSQYVGGKSDMNGLKLYVYKLILPTECDNLKPVFV
jgi:hypothetical protein